MPCREPNRRVVVGLAAVALATAVAGCASTPRHDAATAPPRPQTLQGIAVANQEFGLLAGGGWAQAWALWSPTAQQAISQADFVRLNTECRPALGTPYVISATTALNPDTVRVDWSRGSATGAATTGSATTGSATTGSATVVYLSGSWHFVPDAATLAEYRQGVTALVRQRKAAGSCH